MINLLKTYNIIFFISLFMFWWSGVILSLTQIVVSSIVLSGCITVFYYQVAKFIKFDNFISCLLIFSILTIICCIADVEVRTAHEVRIVDIAQMYTTRQLNNIHDFIGILGSSIVLTVLYKGLSKT